MPEAMPLANLLAESDTEQQRLKLATEIERFVEKELLRHPLIAPYRNKLCVLLTGSTALGIVDSVADVDIELICPESPRGILTNSFREAGLIPSNGGFFVEFTLSGGRKGHYTLLYTRESLKQKLAQDDAEALWIAAASYVLHDEIGVRGLLASYHPLPKDKLRDMRRRSYIEFRSHSKSMDKPVERGDRSALLFAAVAAFEEALRCSMLIEGMPYPYSKWLLRAASTTPAGARIARETDDFVALIGQADTYNPGPDNDNPLVQCVKRMRMALIEAFEAKGVHEPWLREWWKYMD